MNTYSNLLKKENILFQQNPITKRASPFRLVFFQKEKYRFFFVGKKLENQISTSRSNKYSIICSATKEQTNHFNDNSKLNNSFTLKQKNKVDYRFQIYNSTKSATFSETNIQKEKKNYNLNFLKKLNCFNFLLKKNATNKWVNWVNDVNFESFNKIGSVRYDLQVQRSGKENPLNKNLYKTGYSKIHELKLVSVEIASPEKIKEWAEKVLPNGKVFGEVTNANTLHYKTFKPHKGGLFCERIFGPLKDFECACGVRSKPMELESYLNENQQKKRFFCMNCDVEYTWSVIRRYQLGYINLISPVSHIWFLKANPSYLSLLLDFRRSHLESIVYCTEAITLENLWKSSQMLGLDTSPSTLYSIWQKLLEEEKLIKRKHKEIKKIESFLSSHSMPSALSLTHPQNGEAKQSSQLLLRSATFAGSFVSSSVPPTARALPKEPSLRVRRSERAKRKKRKRLNLMYLYINNKDLFYKKNIMSDYIQNSFYKNKILSNNQFYNYENSYEKNLKLMYKKTFFQVLAFTNNTFLFSRSSQKILFFKDLINKLDIYNSLSSLKNCEKNFILSQSLISSLFGIYDYSHNNKLQKENKKRKNLHLKKQIISNIYEKEIVQFKDNFLVLAESFFQIYFTKLYLKDKNLIIQIPNNILQLFCEFFLFYCIQIQLNFYIKKNPLNNLPKILSVNKKKKSSTYNKKNQIFSLKKIKDGYNKILKVSSKIKKGIHSTTGLFYYTGICLFKKQIKLNMFFQKNKKFHLNFPYNKEITYKINFNKKNNLFENVKLSLNSIESNKFSSISIPKSFIPNVQLKKQTNLLQILIQEINYKNDILSIQKNRKNVSDILYLLYEFYKKEMVSYKETSEIEYKQDKKYSILIDIYSLSTFLNLFYIKNNKYKFSEIVNYNNLINCIYKISSNKRVQASAMPKPKLKTKQKDKIFKIQSENAINLTKNCSNLNLTLNKKNTLNQRKKFLFLQKQKSLILRNPQFFSSIYSKKTANNIYYSQSLKERQYKEDWPSSLQKKILKNDLYTISYSHLWPLNADWKSFFYYNSAPKDFEDIHIYYSYRKGSFYNKSNKFSTKLDIVSQIDEIFVSDSMNKDLGSRFGSFSLYFNSLSSSHLLSESERTRSEKRPKPKITKTTEFLSKMNSPVAGAAIVKKLLFEYTPSELKKMVKQHQVLLPKLNQNIRQLKEKAIKKFDFVKIQKLLNKRDHIIRRLKLIRKFSRKNVEPTSMILSVLPVLPPDLRPILKLQNQIAASDLNRLYQKIIYRNERLKKFLKDPSTSQSFEMKYAQRLLQEAVDNLIQNGKGNVKPETNSRGQALKSLSEILKGKQGRFRQYLLGKRVDYSGRSVIVVGPKLKLYECGLPKEMAIELFLPFLIKRILHYKIARTVIGAKNFLYSNKTYCINLLNEIMRNHPVLLNRAPTLHRLGIQAFQPKLVEGRAILLHPLVCPAFNADFDGDQMAVHLPITVEARAEAWTLIFSRNHLISPATGDPIVLPSQDMVLGCYYLTSEKKNISAARLQPLIHKAKEQNSGNKSSQKSSEHDKNFVNSPNQLETNENLNINDKEYKNFFCISNLFNLEKVLNAYQLGKISVQSIVWIKWNGKTQFANEPLSMIEIRLNRYGIHDQIHSKSYKRIDKKKNLLNQYIRTTPGRILINNITQKCMFL
uniref:DNA-directed RNA polymerase subunit gamma n=1 Tax=Pediastrum duplex TaxID=3105 RepID=A0A344PFN8_PEDDU|nr:beta subunit of RNA polymerase [Pediastrum duplex]QFS20085.1 beta subunit of RNA polymerase [Pediastrum duplex]